MALRRSELPAFDWFCGCPRSDLGHFSFVSSIEASPRITDCAVSLTRGLGVAVDGWRIEQDIIKSFSKSLAFGSFSIDSLTRKAMV